MADARRRAFVIATLVTAALLPVAVPAISQEPAEAPSTAAPRSLLPDAHEAPAVEPQPATEPAETPLLRPRAPAVEADSAAPGAPPGEQPDAFALAAPTGRDIAIFGPLGPGVTGPGAGYGIGAFQGADGRFLYALLRRMDLPIASRWAHITLRRALLTEAMAPAGIAPADWVAGRAWALLRMGEVAAAKQLVDAAPVDRYSPALYRVAAQVHLAAADLGGLCPIAATGQALSRDPVWPLAVAICAAMEGDDGTAARIFDELRSNESVDDFDIRLGERIATLAGGGGRAINVDWSDAPGLTIYRWGVATASGVAAPADSLGQLGNARFGWLARAAAVPADVRAEALRPAAVLGVLSGADLVSAVAAGGGGDETGTPAGRLRQAFSAASVSDRMVAIRAIWKAAGDSADGRYGALIETGEAALRIAPDKALAGDAADMMASLLAVGAPQAAARWQSVAEGADSKTKAQAWALLAAGGGSVELSTSRFEDWRSTVSNHRAGLLVAALTGLGRASGDWDSLRSELVGDATNSWTRAIDAAAARRQTGAVVVLAATGLQGRWADVPPLHLQHAIAALVQVGRVHEARMIAAEAVTRG
jgi:hypothetical protein